jgi:hypothetical protein
MNTSIIDKARKAITRVLLLGTDLAVYDRKDVDFDKFTKDEHINHYKKRCIDLENKLRIEQALKPQGLSIEKLTMKQLGSYIPDFIDLSRKGDEFKTRIGLMCSNLIATEEWNYLITHLKQDQVNLSLFSDEPKDDKFVRGSINGIYVVDDQVRKLGETFNSTNKGVEKKKKDK